MTPTSTPSILIRQNGIQAVESFVAYYQNKSGFTGSLNGQDKKLVNDIQAIVNLFAFITQMLSDNEILFQSKIGKIFFKRLKLTTRLCFPSFLNAMSLIGSELRFVRDSLRGGFRPDGPKRGDVELKKVEDINFLANTYTSCLTSLKDLADKDLIKQGKIEIVEARLFFAGETLDISQLNALDLESSFGVGQD